MATETYKVCRLTPYQAQAFSRLAKRVAADMGVVKGMQQLNLTTHTYYNLVEKDQITDKQAVRLMAGYKKWKEHRA